MTHLELKAWRKALKWTQRKAAEEMGISERHYRKLEAGTVKISRTLELACKALP